jgi:hypothetical protein
MGGLCFVAVYKPAAALPRVPDAAGLDGGAGREPSGFDHVTELFDEAGGEVYNLSRAGHIGRFFGGGPGFLQRGFGNLEDYRVVDTYVLGVGVEPAPLSTHRRWYELGDFFIHTPARSASRRCTVRRRSFLRCRRGRGRSSSFGGSRFSHRREGASTYLKPGAARGDTCMGEIFVVSAAI